MTKEQKKKIDEIYKQYKDLILSIYITGSSVVDYVEDARDLDVKFVTEGRDEVLANLLSKLNTKNTLNMDVFTEVEFNFIAQKI